VIGNEDGAAKTAGDTTDDVDDTDSQPTEQLFHVSHKQQLKHDAQQQLQNPAHHTLCKI